MVGALPRTKNISDEPTVKITGAVDGQRRARGIAKMTEVYGWDFADGPGDFWAFTADHLFADIWSRDALDIGQRRMLLIGALAQMNVV